MLRSTSFRRLCFLLAATLGATACGDDPDPIVTPDDFVAPTTSAELDDVYDRLGTCNDSFITRTLTPRDDLEPDAPWTAPAAAPAGPIAWRASGGAWSRVLLANELTFDGVAEDVTNPDAACAAVRALFTPVDGDREQYTFPLLYLDEAAHPYTSFPAGGIEPRRAAAEVSLTSYLAVVSATRAVQPDGTIVFSDVIEQHLPMYVSCTRPFEVEALTMMFDDAELAGIDPAMCDAGRDLDGDGDLDHRCVAERGKHVADNACTFVVDASPVQTLDGASHRVIFGGTLTSRGADDALRYDITIDRFSN